jgi:hypothetical protein
MFDIHLTQEIVPESDGFALYGKIQIDGYVETFIASLVNWTRSQYEMHWLNACQRMIDGETQTVLITTYVEPSISEFLMWWPLYREGDIVHVRNEILIYETLNRPFDVEHPWAFIRKREIFEDGYKIPEWNTQIQSIKEFIDRRSFH